MCFYSLVCKYSSIHFWILVQNSSMHFEEWLCSHLCLHPSLSLTLSVFLSLAFIFTCSLKSLLIFISVCFLVLFCSVSFFNLISVFLTCFLWFRLLVSLSQSASTRLSPFVPFQILSFNLSYPPTHIHTQTHTHT